MVACGNGTAGIFAPLALSKIGIEVIPLHCELDNTFPEYIFKNIDILKNHID